MTLRKKKKKYSSKVVLSEEEGFHKKFQTSFERFLLEDKILFEAAKLLKCSWEVENNQLFNIRVIPENFPLFHFGGHFSLQPKEGYQRLGSSGVYVGEKDDHNEALLCQHSCSPNCKIVVGCRDIFGEGTFWVVSLKEIPPKQPLTIDYRWQADTADGANDKDLGSCSCGAFFCSRYLSYPPLFVSAKKFRSWSGYAISSPSVAVSFNKKPDSAVVCKEHPAWVIPLGKILTVYNQVTLMPKSKKGLVHLEPEFTISVGKYYYIDQSVFQSNSLEMFCSEWISKEDILPIVRVAGLFPCKDKNRPIVVAAQPVLRDNQISKKTDSSWINCCKKRIASLPAVYLDKDRCGLFKLNHKSLWLSPCSVFSNVDKLDEHNDLPTIMQLDYTRELFQRPTRLTKNDLYQLVGMRTTESTTRCLEMLDPNPTDQRCYWLDEALSAFANMYFPDIEKSFFVTPKEDSSSFSSSSTQQRRSTRNKEKPQQDSFIQTNFKAVNPKPTTTPKPTPTKSPKASGTLKSTRQPTAQQTTSKILKESPKRKPAEPPKGSSSKKPKMETPSINNVAGSYPPFDGNTFEKMKSGLQTELKEKESMKIQFIQERERERERLLETASQELQRQRASHEKEIDRLTAMHAENTQMYKEKIEVLEEKVERLVHENSKLKAEKNHQPIMGQAAGNIIGLVQMAGQENEKLLAQNQMLLSQINRFEEQTSKFMNLTKELKNEREKKAN